MLQVYQQVKTGKTELREVPTPNIVRGRVLVRTEASLISAGTERMLLDFSKKNLLEKARSRPDLVKQVLDKAQRDGWLATLRTVRTRLDSPLPLGYSATGVVAEVGQGVERFKVGQRVAVAGAGYANHAEYNCIPANLVVAVPEVVTPVQACYTTVSSIALQGLRIAEPVLGECVGVIGLGLIGLITVQLLKAAGCRVVGIDPDASKQELAKTLGLDLALSPKDGNLFEAIEAFSRARGLDRVLITASTKSNQPIEMAGKLLRHRGSLTVVGAVGMDVPRDLFYKKELDLRLSMSYGPGRYDFTYEEGGIDYPFPFVRWTENRNMEAVLDMLAQGKLDVDKLTTHQFTINQALDAYRLLEDSKASYVGVVLTCPERPGAQEKRIQIGLDAKPSRDVLGVSFVGAGNYASQFLLPHLKAHPQVRLQGLVTSNGLTARHRAEKFGFLFCSTDCTDVIDSPSTDAVFVATRHDSHARYVLKALQMDKAVFVEKPIAIDHQQLEEISLALASGKRKVCVGLNRRFSPLTQSLRDKLPAQGPMQMLYRINSGKIPMEAWTHSQDQGGGMLVGEMCHFVDMALYLLNGRPQSVIARSVRNSAGGGQDDLCAIVTFDNNRTFNLFYSTLGDKAAPKERLELYYGNSLAILDDFRSLEIFSNGERNLTKLQFQDKGQKEMISRVVSWFSRGGQPPMEWEQIETGMRVIFAIQQSLRTNQVVEL